MTKYSDQNMGETLGKVGHKTPIELHETSAGHFAPAVQPKPKRNPMDNKAVRLAAKFYASVPRVSAGEMGLVIVLILGGLVLTVWFGVWYLLTAVWGFFCWLGFGWGGGEKVEHTQPKTTQPTNIIINQTVNISNNDI